jgi:hypothetical protein
MKMKTALFTWNLMSHFKAIFVLFLLGGVLLATDTTGAGANIKCAMHAVCAIMNDLVPFIAFTLFVIAGAAYGAGQFFGADTRAKASGWAMSAITGAIIMILIYLIGPTIINSLYGSTAISTSGSDRCSSIIQGITCAT